MSVKNYLTNEKLNARFDNSFTLVNYAIGLAKDSLKKGRLTEGNLACEILDAIVDLHDILPKNPKEEIIIEGSVEFEEIAL